MVHVVSRPTSRTLLLAAIAGMLCVSVGGCSLKNKIPRRLFPAHAMTLKTEINEGKASSDNNVLYLPAAVQGHDDLSWIEAYSISGRKP